MQGSGDPKKISKIPTGRKVKEPLDPNLYFKNGKLRKTPLNKKNAPIRSERTVPTLALLKKIQNKEDKEEESEEEQEEEEKEDEGPLETTLDNGIITSVRFGSQEHPVPQNFKVFSPEIELDEFRNFAAIMYGKRRSGKSVQLRDFLYRTRKWYDVAYSFSQTSILQKDLFDYIPEDNQRDGLDIEFLEKICAEQKADVEMKLRNHQENKIKNILFIFDDVISDPRIRNSASYNALHTMGRHLRTATITLTQSVGGREGLPKVVRDNVDLTICFYPQNQIDREAIIERYLSIENKKIGDAILKNITFEKFQSIAIMNIKTARSYEDFVFTYKCSGKTPKFTIGTKVLSMPREINMQGHIGSKSNFKFNIQSEDDSETTDNIIL
jgi:hypothetical protein